MSFSRADGEDHRKLERHCFAFLQRSRCGLAPTLSVSKKGKYGVLSLLDVWVQPEMMWARAWPQHLHKALPVLPPRWRKGQVFPLVSLILKECGVPSDTGKTPIYITLLIQAGQENSETLALFLKRFWSLDVGSALICPFTSEVWSGAEFFAQETGETRWLKHPSATASPETSAQLVTTCLQTLISSSSVIIVYRLSWPLKQSSPALVVHGLGRGL